MATTTLCPDCDKQEGIVPCLGCKKIFCVKHFQIHRQNLSVELENVVTRRNTLQEYYFNTVASSFDPTKFEAWSAVDEWEQKIKEQARQIAGEARKQLDAHSKQSRTQIENRLNQMTETIQQKMERENFVEEDIEKLTHEIDQIEEGMQNNKFHPRIEIISEPIDWKASLQVKLVIENEPKNEKIKPSTSPPPPSLSSVAPVVSSKANYPPSVQRKCFTCGADTWQKECKCCSHTYCGWHLKRHANESKKH
ncbi:unnamed protein product [Rotaria socialis]|nr:unnamed protein product [Rotaria socialis]